MAGYVHNLAWNNVEDAVDFRKSYKELKAAGELIEVEGQENAASKFLVQNCSSISSSKNRNFPMCKTFQKQK